MSSIVLLNSLILIINSKEYLILISPIYTLHIKIYNAYVCYHICRLFYIHIYKLSDTVYFI